MAEEKASRPQILRKLIIMNQNPTKKKQRILLVEDNKITWYACQETLKREGYDVIVAQDAPEAIKKLKEKKPDLILLDLILPHKSGFEVLEEIRQDESLKKVPVIILSNLGEEADIQRGKELGAVDYLLKANMSMKDVISRVRVHLKDTD